MIEGDRPLRVLFADDNPDDRLLAIRALKREFSAIEALEVTGPEAFAARLAAADFDVAVVDYDLRWTDGLTLLHRIRERLPNCPTVMFTGTGSELVAVNAMRNGLDDYVLKSAPHRQRLHIAVRRAIERRSTRQALAADQEERVMELLDRLPVGVYRTSPAGELLYANPALRRMLDIPPHVSLEGHRVEDAYVVPARRAEWREVMEQKGVVHAFEIELQTPGGRRLWVRDSASAVTAAEGDVRYYEGVMEDITRERDSEGALRQSQKMQAVGRLAGGIAHDFNNLLSVILGEAELALLDLPEDGAGRAALVQIQQSAERASALTRQLLAFSRRSASEPVQFHLNDLVRDLESMLTRLLLESVTLDAQLADEATSVWADRRQLEQVLVNLVVNARDAMAGGGVITIATDRRHLGGDLAQIREDVTPGEYVVMSVADTGVGMTSEVRNQAFEPFFTTKGEKGTGLGLATCYGIVRQAGGHIGIVSEPGQGTTVRVYLPAASEPADVDAAPDPSVPVPYGTEHILLVEDDDAVRDTTGRMLKALGYRVTAAADATTAIEALHADLPDLLVTDIVLPDMNGPQLVDRVHGTHPALPVVYASGYSDETALQRLVTQQVRLVRKPIILRELADQVRAALDG